MAKRNSPTTEQDRERLRVKDGCWRIHTHDIYRGNAADLIAAGLVRPEQLPGTEGMPSTSATFYDGQLMARHQRCKCDVKHMNIVRSNSRFTVYVGVTAEVRTRREAIDKRDDEVREERRKAQRDEQQARAQVDQTIARTKRMAEGTLILMPTSPDEYRQNLIRELDSSADILRKRMLPSEGNGLDVLTMGVNGFSLDESAVTEFDDLVNEIRELLSNADVRFNAQRQKEIISNCKGAIAKADGGFQRALDRIQQSAPESTIDETAEEAE